MEVKNNGVVELSVCHITQHTIQRCAFLWHELKERLRTYYTSYICFQSVLWNTKIQNKTLVVHI